MDKVKQNLLDTLKIALMAMKDEHDDAAYFICRDTKCTWCEPGGYMDKIESAIANAEGEENG